eukprot:4669673-Prymnesium_polylepis.1
MAHPPPRRAGCLALGPGLGRRESRSPPLGRGFGGHKLLRLALRLCCVYRPSRRRRASAPVSRRNLSGFAFGGVCL